MRNPFKTFAVLFSLSILFVLSACELNNCGDDFVCLLEADYEKGVSYEDIAFNLMVAEYGDLPDPTEELFKDFDFDKMDKEHEEYEKNLVKLVADIQNRRCEEILDYMENQYPGIESSRKELYGIYYKEGICVKQDYSKAAELFKEALQDGGRSLAAVHLGSLYLEGLGVPEDKIQAEKYFQKAAIWQAGIFWESEHIYFDAKDTTDFKIWGLTVRQMEKNFARTELGPWELPKPLNEQIIWLEELQKGDGSEVVEVAKDLFQGEGGFEKDLESALQWAAYSGRIFGNKEGEYLHAIWGMDQSICSERKQLDPYIDCQWEFSFALGGMEQAAFDNNEKALKFIISYYLQKPEKKWADWSLYQYLLLGKKRGLEINPEILENSKLKLSHFEQGLIETWVREKYSLPITNYLPN